MACTNDDGRPSKIVMEHDSDSTKVSYLSLPAVSEELKFEVFFVNCGLGAVCDLVFFDGLSS